MIEGDGDETVYVSPPKGQQRQVCSGCHFLVSKPSVMDGASPWTDCTRFPTWYPVSDADSHYCGEWRSKVR